MAFFNFFKKKTKEEEIVQVSDGLEVTRKTLWDKISSTVVGKRTVDPEYLDQLEEILISSDVGVKTTLEIIAQLEAKVSKDKYINNQELSSYLLDITSKLMPNIPTNLIADFQTTDFPKPYIIFVVGVNGVGKTTTIGKIAYKYGQMGKKVVLGAADTFRAAAVDQLEIWKNRANVEIVSKGMNADPSAVVYDTIAFGLQNQADIIIIDTAGRLHNKVSLMNELAKMRRVVDKFNMDFSIETLLVLDATTGQNAFEQAKVFSSATKVNTLAITKLDGTAKGGVAIGVSYEHNLPIKYIGIGEKVDDLLLFDKQAYLQSIFKNEN